MKTLDVLCIGELNVDIFCNYLEKMPEPGSFILMDKICMYPGGCPTNTAIVTSKLNLKTGLCSLVGNDNVGDFVLSELKKEGVDTDSVVQIEEGETGKTIILTSRVKDRVLLHDTGVNELLTIDRIDLDKVAASRAVLISSYVSGLPNISNKDAAAIFSHARQNGCITFLDVLVDPDDPEMSARLEGVLEFTDFIILNNIEGKLLTGKETYEQQADELLKLGASNVIIKLGKEGSYFKNKKQHLKVNPYRTEAVDPTGSGDAFNGGFIYSRLQGWDIEKSMKFANVLGASAVTKIGCTCGVYCYDELDLIEEIIEKGELL